MNKFKQSSTLQRLYSEDIFTSPRFHTQPQTLSTSRSTPLLTEDIFTAQRTKIQTLKLSHQHLKRKITEDELYLNHEKLITLIAQPNQHPSSWEYSTFTTEQFSSQEIPIINFTKWNQSETFYSPVIIRNLIFKSTDEIDYGLANVELSIKLTLQHESTCWLFLHGDNDTFTSHKKQHKDNLTSIAIIRIDKEESSQNAFISLGVFVDDGKFEVFSRQQLVNVCRDKSNNVYVEEDKIFMKIHIQDPGDDNMQIKINLNNSLFENTLDADYFYPVNNKKRFLIAGSGEKCVVSQFDIMSYVKPKYVREYNILSHKNPYHLNSKNCDCCNVM
jgi:hypothetical protein